MAICFYCSDNCCKAANKLLTKCAETNERLLLIIEMFFNCNEAPGLMGSTVVMVQGLLPVAEYHGALHRLLQR